MDRWTCFRDDRGCSYESDEMPNNPRVFSVAVVLSAYHNRLLVPFDELRGLLEYMCGQKVWLWEVPLARSLSAAHLLKQYPWLDEIEPPPGFKNDAVSTNRFVKSVIKMIGADTLTVYTLPPNKFKSHGPFETAGRKR